MGKGKKDQSASGPVPDPGPDGPTAPPVRPGADDAAEDDAEKDDTAQGDAGPGDAGDGDSKDGGSADSGSADSSSPHGDAGNSASGDSDAVESDPVATDAVAGDAAGSDGPTEVVPAAAGEPALLGELLPPAPPVTPAPKRRRRRVRRVLVSMALTMAVLAAGAVTSAYVLVRRLDNQITSEEVTEKIGPYRPKVMPEAYGAVNILLMGSDDRSGANVKYGNIYDTTRRSDTTILLHLSADRKSSVAVSIPRDLMVQIPSCVRDDGSVSAAYKDQFNHAFEIGGSACTIKTVEQMTRVQINHHIVIDFTGFKRMVDAVDGVEVCLSEPLRDYDAKLDLGAGLQKLNGEQSLAFVRARKELGDGSDTQRMVRQQRFLASLMNKVKSNGVLFNPKKLYDLLDAGTSSITADPGLDSLDELTKLSKSVSNIPSDKSAFLTVPRQQYRYDTNRDELVQPDADALFTAIRYDRVAVGKADPGTLLEPGGSVRIDAPAPADEPAAEPVEPSSGTTQPPGRRTTSQPSGTPVRTGAPDGGTPADPNPTDTFTIPTGAVPTGAVPTGTVPTATATAGDPGPTTGPPGSGAATAPPSPSATQPVPAGPIVTVTGRTVDEDTCT
ncbi:LCP family protein [Streptodolium elevatio]|uniref:LCP family protein n=1 Tax=Streptodolium elevatio TaxID=3157996 RepID=A0ABV3DFJ8_9ACTN